MVTNKENLFKLGKKMTDRIPYKLGLKPMTEDCPEYWGMANVLSDEMVEVALTMKQRTPTSLREFVERTGKDEQHLEELQELTGQGVSIEFVHDNKLSDGQCQIETAFGVFDCSVDTELSNLMKDIRSLV